jgi:hypothetical protein
MKETTERTRTRLAAAVAARTGLPASKINNDVQLPGNDIQLLSQEGGRTKGRVVMAAGRALAEEGLTFEEMVEALKMPD